MAILLAIAIAISTHPVYTHEVEYKGEVYAYTSTANAEEVCTSDDYIVTLDGETVYITDIVGGENR